MGYDRIWIKTVDLADAWLERRQADEKDLSKEFDRHHKRLREQGDFIVLVAGKNLAFDELFLSDNSSVLLYLYEHEFSRWQSFLDDAEEGCGFQEVSLYQAGRLKATKAVAPSTRKGLLHE